MAVSEIALPSSSWRKIVCEKMSMAEFTVHNNVGEKYPNVFLLPVRF